MLPNCIPQVQLCCREAGELPGICQIREGKKHSLRKIEKKENWWVLVKILPKASQL